MYGILIREGKEGGGKNIGDYLQRQSLSPLSMSPCVHEIYA